MICVYAEYNAFLINHTILNEYNTLLYLIIDYVHVFIFWSVFFLICNTIVSNCNLNYLFILNIFAFSTILLFFYFKKCVLSLYMYNIIDVKQWVSPVDRLKYMVGLDKNYNIDYRDAWHNDMYTWMNSQYLFFGILLLLNMYCFVKKKKC